MLEPERHVYRRDLPAHDVDIPPTVRRSKKIAKIASSLRFLNDQCREIGLALLDTGSLERLQQLCRNRARCLLDSDVSAAGAEIIVRNPDHGPTLAGRVRKLACQPDEERIGDPCVL